MDSRIQSKFVISNRRLLEVDTQTELEELVLATAPNLDGRLFDVTITFKLTSDKPWARCEQLGYWRDDQCNQILAPNAQCQKDHFHRPDWIDPDPDDPDDSTRVCTECERLGVEPSRTPDVDNNYNHRNSGKQGY